MLRNDAFEFLKSLSAYSSLEDASLQKLVDCLVMKFYPNGTIILRQQDPPSQIVHMIRQGGVKIYVETGSGERRVIDYRGEGDMFGCTSLTDEECPSVFVQAIADTTCYLAGRNDILHLAADTPAITDLFSGSLARRDSSLAYGEMLQKHPLYGESEKLLFTTPVGELCRKGAVTAGRHVSIRSAAQLMSSNRISSLVIVDGKEKPIGIVTDADLREKVLARSTPPDDQVSAVMSTDLITINSADYCYEAVLKMLENRIHHLLVLESGKLIGVLTHHDLMTLQGISPLIIIREIDRQESIIGLAAVSGKIISLVGILLREGAQAGNITRIVTEINDHLERRILDIARETLGPSPVPFCWIIYGSEGRKEQTFKTDQDNAIIYADPTDSEQARLAEEYFSRLAAFVVDGLVHCGFTRCSGNYMATNPKWCQPLSVWKRYFSEWIYEPTQEALIFSVILFDFRGLYGESGLAAELKRHLMEALRGQKIFLKCLADMTSQVGPPLGFFGTFRVEDEGEHRNMLDLKKTCIAPILNISRLFSLESGIYETSTLERIRALKSVHAIAGRIGDDLEQAFEFVSLLRIRHQYGQIAGNIEPDNFINPDRLSMQEKNTLKNVCLLISRVLDGIVREYNPGAAL